MYTVMVMRSFCRNAAARLVLAAGFLLLLQTAAPAGLASPDSTSESLFENAGAGRARLLPSRTVAWNDTDGDGSAGASPYPNKYFQTPSEPAAGAGAGGDESTLAEAAPKAALVVTTLANNVPVSGLSGAKGSLQLFKITVPDGQAQLNFGIWSDRSHSLNTEIFITRGAAPTLASYGYHPRQLGIGASQVVLNPAGGDWFILLHGTDKFATITLLASFGPAQPDLMGVGIVQMGTSTAPGATIKYTVAVTNLGGAPSAPTSVYYYFRTDPNDFSSLSKVGEVAVPALAPGQGVNTATFSYTVPLTTLAAVYDLRRVIDGPGWVAESNEMNNEGTQLVVVSGPGLTVKNLAANQRLSNSVFTVTGTAPANKGVVAVWYQLNDGAWLTANGTTNWSAPLGLSDRTNIFRVYAADARGDHTTMMVLPFVHVACAPMTVQVPPGCKVTPACNGALLELGRSYMLTAQHGPGFVFSNWTAGLGGPVVTNTAVVRFTMVSNLVLAANFIDVQPPSVAITSPKAGQWVSNGLFTVKGTASDNGRVSSLWVALNGAPPIQAAGTTNWSLADVLLRQGSNTVAAYAVDNAGVLSAARTASFVYVVSGVMTVQMTGNGTVTPNYAHAWLEIGRAYSMTARAGTGSYFTNWTAGLGGPLVTTQPTVQFNMVSNLVLTANFVDVQPPKVAITSPKTGQRLSNSVVTVKGTAGDNAAVAAVWYQINSNGWVLADGTTNWTAHVTLLPGTNYIYACAADPSTNYSPVVGVQCVCVASHLTSLSTNWAAPLSILTITGSGFNTNLPLSVRFSDGQSFRVEVPVTNISPHSVAVPMPPYIDPLTGDFSSGTVSVQVVQTSKVARIESNPLPGLTIGPMPALSLPAGSVTVNWTGFLGLYLADVKAHLQEVETFTGVQVATADLQAKLEIVRSNLVQIHDLALTAMANPSQPPTIGTFSGHPVILDQDTLRRSDQVLVAMAQQILTNIQAPSGPVFHPLEEGSPAAAAPVSDELAKTLSCNLDAAAFFHALILSPRSEDLLNANYKTLVRQCADYYRQDVAPRWQEYSLFYAGAALFPPATEAAGPLALATSLVGLYALGAAAQLDTMASYIESNDPNNLASSQSDWDETYNRGKCWFIAAALECVFPGTPVSPIFHILSELSHACETDVPRFVSQGTVFVSPQHQTNPPPMYNVTVVIAGDGSGRVGAAPSGFRYASNTLVTLTATPDAGSTFTSWGGDCTGTAPCSFRIRSDKLVTANFHNPDATWNGTWSGNWGYSDSGGCVFGGGGNASVTLSVTKGTASGSGTIAGIECKDMNNCSHLDYGTGSGSVSGTASGTAVTLRLNSTIGGGRCAGGGYSILIHGTRTGTRITGTVTSPTYSTVSGWINLDKQ
jgi:hypothetical protein